MVVPFLKTARIAAATILINASALPPPTAVSCTLSVFRVLPSVSMCIRAKRSFASWTAYLKIEGKSPLTFLK
ncbi:hypothetical protein JQ615_05785 [Bradyrhizobium jicamae]|uniref:Secreted protein n=1 Tax=Bradyrhizobium jicamae TaxID=280332 RepID=A0ABS5FDM0_9BRAD|nr:hypothetical protein [Bradyrhizobium jicamae]MBR0794899.1 hypothetical protein [Bradyrhizobium jicamae]MBR0938895.1 hypothetical protein [Bradyrhizobium jicamae]